MNGYRRTVGFLGGRSFSPLRLYGNRPGKPRAVIVITAIQILGERGTILRHALYTERHSFLRMTLLHGGGGAPYARLGKPDVRFGPGDKRLD
jgi:hypothetical protein